MAKKTLVKKPKKREELCRRNRFFQQIFPDKGSQHGTDDRGNDEEPELRECCTADNEGRSEAPCRVDRYAGYRNTDYMDYRKGKTDRNTGKSRANWPSAWPQPANTPKKLST